MHVERLTKIAEWLEAGAQHENFTFDMGIGIGYDVSGFERDADGLALAEPTPEDIMACGTSCCIAGAAVQFFNDPRSKIEDVLEERFEKYYQLVEEGQLWWGIVRKEAKTLLDLNEVQATYLFEPSMVYGGELSDYNDPSWAARVIRHMLATGDVDWSACKDGMPE